jgi:3-oxoacyl-[acyl-carrier protein] reductase
MCMLESDAEGHRPKTEKEIIMSKLANKTALVTGASRGMGRATALALAASGARVIVHYGRNADEAKSVVDQIRAAGGRADAIAADLAAPDGAHMLAAQVHDLVGGSLDIIVANAGISKSAAIEDMTVKDFDNLFAVNVRSPYFLVQQLMPILSDGGSIVFLSSLGARTAVGSLSAYAATKGAIDTLVKYFAVVLGGRGIRVNAVAPGVIDTDMSNFTKTAEGRAAVQGMQALKRIGQPADVATVIAFLASDDARWITGDTIHVDGGSRL